MLSALLFRAECYRRTCPAAPRPAPRRPAAAPCRARTAAPRRRPRSSRPGSSACPGTRVCPARPRSSSRTPRHRSARTPGRPAAQRHRGQRGRQVRHVQRRGRQHLEVQHVRGRAQLVAGERRAVLAAGQRLVRLVQPGDRQPQHADVDGGRAGLAVRCCPAAGRPTGRFFRRPAGCGDVRQRNADRNVLRSGWRRPACRASCRPARPGSPARCS